MQTVRKFTALVVGGLIAALTLIPMMGAQADVRATFVQEAIVAQQSQSLVVQASAVATPVVRDEWVIENYSVVQWPTIRQDLTDCFGCRSGGHMGIDISWSGVNGTPVMAAVAGTVVMSGWNGSYGNCVIIDSVVNGVPTQTLYGHMQDGSLAYPVGATVWAGDQIGLVGTTGGSTGPHLHFEVHPYGVPVDPLTWLYANVRE